MNTIVIQQTVVGSILVALLCLVLLLGVLLILGSFTGAPYAQSGIMLIAPHYHLA
jgi:hypothetical protein